MVVEYSQIVLEYMDNHGVTGYRLAKDTGLSESLFGKWRAKPTSKIDATTLAKIADYFSITISELLKEVEKEKPADEFGELSNSEKRLLHKFREMDKLRKDMMLRAAGIDPDHPEKSNTK